MNDGDGLGELLASFEPMGCSELLHEARRWAYNAKGAEAKLKHVQAAWQRDRDESVLKLARVSQLLSVRHKTLRMDALRDALRETDVIEAESEARS
jgi:hypothetical protein